MKKIYLLAFSIGFVTASYSQLTLTKAANEPVNSNINSVRYYDSVGVVPKTLGNGQTWNFGSFVQSTVNTISNYSNAVSVPSSSNFPGCTLVEVQSGGDKLYWKSVSTPSTQFELIGMDQASGLSLTYTNSAIAAMWPISSGYVLVDPFSGTLSVMSQTGVVSGSITTQGSGTGTLILPGNFPMNNILQMKMSQQIFISVPGVSYGATITSTEYQYFSGTQKFPLLVASYEKQVEQIGTPTITITNNIKVNNAVLTGLNERNFDASFRIFPNPARDAFHVNLENNSGETGSIEIFNSTGHMIRKIELGNSPLIDKQVGIADLSSGVYLVKTNLGDRQSARKLIVE